MERSEPYQEIKQLFHQCLFKKALLTIEGCKAQGGFSAPLELLKVSGLFEIHKVDQARGVLKELSATLSPKDPYYAYALGRLSYYDRDYPKARECFESLLDQAESLSDYYLGLIGLANLAVTEKKWLLIAGYLCELKEMYQDRPLDCQISVDLLKAQVAFLKDQDIKEAKRLIYQVVGKAAPKGWVYYLAKAHYQLAGFYQAEKDLSGIRSTLELIKAYLEPGDGIFLRYLVSEKFKECEVLLGNPLTLDEGRLRVRVGEQWLDLGHSPLLFSFLTTLAQRKGFTSKKELAHALWPEEEYQSSRHDPRIFDMAKRLRQMIEVYDQQPVTLLSGRFGYKLACQTIEEPQDVKLSQRL